MITTSFIYHSEDTSVEADTVNIPCPFCQKPLKETSTKRHDRHQGTICFRCPIKAHKDRYAEFEVYYEVEEVQPGVDIAYISTIFLDIDDYRLEVDYIYSPNDFLEIQHTTSILSKLDPEKFLHGGLKNLLETSIDTEDTIEWDWDNVDNLTKQIKTFIAFS